MKYIEAILVVALFVAMSFPFMLILSILFLIFEAVKVFVYYFFVSDAVWKYGVVKQIWNEWIETIVNTYNRIVYL